MKKKNNYDRTYKTKRKMTIENEIAKFLIWVNDNQPLYAKNEKVKNLIRKNIVAPFIGWEKIIEEAYRLYKEEVRNVS